MLAGARCPRRSQVADFLVRLASLQYRCGAYLDSTIMDLPGLLAPPCVVKAAPVIHHLLIVVSDPKLMLWYCVCRPSIDLLDAMTIESVLTERYDI